MQYQTPLLTASFKLSINIKLCLADYLEYIRRDFNLILQTTKNFTKRNNFNKTLACHLVMRNQISAKNCFTTESALISSTPTDPRRIMGFVPPHKIATKTNETE